MTLAEQIKKEMKEAEKGIFSHEYFRSIGYENTTHTSPYEMRADGIYTLFTVPVPKIYRGDLIVGSMQPLFLNLSDGEKEKASKICAPFPERKFATGRDHCAPDYVTVLNIGIGGLLEKISKSEKNHKGDKDALSYLNAMRISLNALQERIRLHVKRADELMGADGYDKERLLFIKKNCEAIVERPPESFAEALQLVWMIHSSFVVDMRFAVALGRLDRYLYPYFKKEIESGELTKERTTELLENIFIKICERRMFRNHDDVVNICIGGVDGDGKCAVNGLSYCILEAVKNVNMPGPNLSARITPDTPDEFLDECLKSIGTGLGYPALMNDTVNMAALSKYGYDENDVRNYSMVGCVENFMTGKQPPWTDDRFDTPRFLEYVLFNGAGYDKTKTGIKTVPLSEITSMKVFMREFEKQLASGVNEYMGQYRKLHVIEDGTNYTSPFLSCFFDDCIEKGRDLNMGGTRYPSAHGASLMGIATVSDSLAAIEKVVFCDREATLQEVADAMKANFVGYEDLHKKLLAAPKYGNNDNFVDKYAVWFTSYLSDVFSKYKTYDGGGIYTSIASNVSNIPAGKIIGATPDGRLAGEPLSDAASPTYGRDTRGATSTVLSVSKPDYTNCACGTVVNQKYSPAAFSDGKRDKLLQLIKVYFSRGGQEIQINATSSEILKDAMEHPENYQSLVVRVSGFSALYVTLDKEVQKDILNRTQQG